MEIYLAILRRIMEEGILKPSRTGIDTLTIPPVSIVHDMANGFPLLTTKKIGFKTVAHELIWFLSGETNIKYLVNNNIRIWDDDAFNHNLDGLVKDKVFPEKFKKYSEEWLDARNRYVSLIKEDSNFAEKWGDLGPVYGSQWLHWPRFSPVNLEINGEKKQVVVFAANVTEETTDLIEDLLATDLFVKFALQNKVNLSDNTVLIRLAIINLRKNLPSNDEVLRYKSALLRPHEFDDFLKEELGAMKNAV